MACSCEFWLDLARFETQECVFADGEYDTLQEAAIDVDGDAFTVVYLDQAPPPVRCGLQYKRKVPSWLRASLSR